MSEIGIAILNAGGLPAMLLLGIGALMWKFGPQVFDLIKANNTKLKDIDDKVDLALDNDRRQDKAIKELRLDSLKSKVYNPQLPPEERMFMAARYLKLGGNGTVKEYCDKELRNLNSFMYDNVMKQMLENNNE